MSTIFAIKAYFYTLSSVFSNFLGSYMIFRLNFFKNLLIFLQNSFSKISKNFSNFLRNYFKMSQKFSQNFSKIILIFDSFFKTSQNLFHFLIVCSNFSQTNLKLLQFNFPSKLKIFLKFSQIFINVSQKTYRKSFQKSG